MLKHVAIADLRVGMYVHEIGGDWLDHPFWRTSFLIDSEDLLCRIRDSGAGEAWIDTARGGDVPEAETRPEADARIERDLAADARNHHLLEAVDTGDEVAAAAAICARARSAVAALFNDARMGRTPDVAGIAPLVDEITGSVARNPGVLVTLARLRDADDYTFMHSIAVCALMVALARQFGLSDEETRQAGLGGLLHDIGKVEVPLAILNKRGSLSDGEVNAIRAHSEAGHAILAKTGGIGAIALSVCLHHHERVDGSGYPHRLAGNEIDRYARMAAVCDVYDAITSERPYKGAWSAAHALRKMAEWAPTHFDTATFHAFVKCVGIYPIGTLVALRSGRLGVVVDQGEASLLQPRVKVFYSRLSQTRIAPEVVDLAQPGGDEILSHEDPAKWGVADLLELWSGLGGSPW